VKRITRFNPAGDRDAAERHYTDAHHPFMRRMFREHGELLVRYVANRALAQYDLAGGFGERPSAWRFVITEVDDAAGASGFLPERFQPLIWDDHRKVLQDIDAWEVDEEVLVDRRSGQTGLVKYLLLYRAGDAAEDRVARARRYAGEHVPFLRDAFAQAYGARLYVSNRVVREAETSDAFGPGAAYAGTFRPSPKLLAIDELWFDNDAWADEFFGDAAVLVRLRDSPLGRAEGYRVAETIGVDKR
jgi:hypothetical protein